MSGVWAGQKVVLGLQQTSLLSAKGNKTSNLPVRPTMKFQTAAFI
jgi:hypothetical protein